MLPVLLPTITEARNRAIPRAAPATIEANSADLLSILIPKGRQLWWGAVASRLGWQGTTATYDRVAFLGYLPLALAAYGWWAARPRAHFWGVTALVFALLALGPSLQRAGSLGPFGLPWPIPLPYRLMHALPGLEIARVPSRFALVAILALAVLAGIGVAHRPSGWQCCSAPRRGWRSLPCCSAPCWASNCGHQSRSPPSRSRPTSHSWREPGTILDLPYYPKGTLSLRYQTIHRQPIVGGYLSRDLDYPLLGLVPFPSILHRQTGPDIVVGEPPGLALATLVAANVRWVVVNLDLIPHDEPRLAPELAAALEATPAYEDADFAVYRSLPLPAPASPRLAVTLARGWDEPERLGAGERQMRWFARPAGLDLWNLSTIAQRATLRFEAASFHGPRELRVSVDGREAGRYRIDGWQSLAIPVALAPGRHRVTLATSDAPTRPVDVGIGGDSRELAISVADVTLGREAADASPSEAQDAAPLGRTGRGARPRGGALPRRSTAHPSQSCRAPATHSLPKPRRGKQQRERRSISSLSLATIDCGQSWLVTRRQMPRSVSKTPEPRIATDS